MVSQVVSTKRATMYDNILCNYPAYCYIRSLCLLVYFPARLTCTWHGKEEIKMIILRRISSHTAIKIHIVDKLRVTVLHPTLIRHSKLIRCSF